MQPLYTSVKVNNEIELCEVLDNECKQMIERALLKERISYYIRWPKQSFFSRKKFCCIICVNDNAKAQAEEVVQAVCDETGYNVRFILKKSPNNYL
ncbi:MAG: hypothetical protein IJ833_01435 [Lachnospiraceae bacterium]|nr:hypothetical protein [Lachnospiraceae bacterium]